MWKICAGGTAVKDIYYVNSNNEKIDLLEPPYMLQTGIWQHDYGQILRITGVDLPKTVGRELESLI